MLIFAGPMDIELLRTFLEVERTGHFGRAADRLFVTQSAVSSRIRLLEETMGVPVFTRRRNDIQLTPAGMRLKKHAETMVAAWERARQETGLEGDYVDAISVGALWDLWDILLQHWLGHVRDSLPGTALQVEAHATDMLVRKLVDGLLDLAFMFEAPRVSELDVRQVATVTLRMVSTHKGIGVREATHGDYVMVDWGQVFALQHARHFPDMPVPGVRMGFGSLALNYLLARGGSAYLAEQVLENMRGRKQLYVVRDAPVIERAAYAVYRPGTDREETLRRSLSCFRAIT
jgi:DNA-binding transcriptional LysR family regulator